MNRLAALALGTLVLAPGANAADLQAELSACIALQDKTAQLACFDQVAVEQVSGKRADATGTPASETPSSATKPAMLQSRLSACIALSTKADQLACFDRVGVDRASASGAVARSAPVAAEDSLQARLESCMALPTKPAKLACFDGVADDRGAGDGSASVATAASPAAQTPSENLQARLGDCIALSDKSAQMKCFEEIRGAERGPGYSAARMNAETGEFEYRAILSRVSDGRSFFMEDGQVWRALNPAPAPFRQGEFVVIRPSGGSFVMSQAGTRETAGVTRVR